MRANPDVEYRYYFSPPKALLKPYEILNFGWDWTGPLVKQGIYDAFSVI